MTDGCHLHLVVMGVSGTGKSAVASALAPEWGLTMAEGDEFHPAANVAKMRSGVALDDDDRAAWLAVLAGWTRERHREGRGTVVACSALRRAYRDPLRAAVPEPTFFVHLRASPEVIRERMAAREHFMPAALLESQLATLEPLAADEFGGEVDAVHPLAEVVGEASRLVGEHHRQGSPPDPGGSEGDHRGC